MLPWRAAMAQKVKLIKPKKRCCKSAPRCKKCPVVCKRLMKAGAATKRPNGHYVVDLGVGKKALKAARAR
jgi:hypothetical protein